MQQISHRGRDRFFSVCYILVPPLMSHSYLGCCRWRCTSWAKESGSDESDSHRPPALRGWRCPHWRWQSGRPGWRGPRGRPRTPAPDSLWQAEGWPWAAPAPWHGWPAPGCTWQRRRDCYLCRNVPKICFIELVIAWLSSNFFGCCFLLVYSTFDKDSFLK